MGNERASTGIAGFDRLAAGGFSRGTINLVGGPAGSGKSLFALHFAYHGASDVGEPALYLVLEEPRANVERVTDMFGMDLRPLEDRRVFFLIDLGEIRPGGKDRKAVVGFDELQDFLKTTLPKTGAKRLVVDSLSAVGPYYPTPEDFRERMFSFSRFLRNAKVTTLLVSEAVEGEGLTRYGVEQFLADSFVYLGLEEIKGELRRTLTIRKMRFTRHDTAKHPFHIGTAGVDVLADEKVI